MPGTSRTSGIKHRRLLILTVLLTALLGLALFIVGSDDGIHHFEDQYGEYQVVLTSNLLSRLLPSVAFAAFVLAVVWVTSSAAIALFSGRPLWDIARVDALSYAPLAVFLLLLLRYIPGLARFSSALFLLSTTLSPVLLLIAALLVIALKVYLFRDLFERRSLFALFPKGISDRAVGWIVFMLLMAVLAITIPQFSASWPFGGDEPHYLIVTHSLLEDGDIYFQDDYDDGVYRQFSQWQRITPQYLRLTHDGREVPIHRIGVPLMAVPAYAIAGKLGAVLMIGFFAALAAANLYWLIVKVVPKRNAALLAVAWVGLSIPMLPLSFMFYTEVPLACFILLALNMIIRHGNAPLRWPWLIPFVIWFLPWIHARGYMTAIALSILLLVRLRNQKKLLAAGIAALCLLLSLAIPAWNWWLYGEFGLLAEMGGAQYRDVSVFNVFNNFGGLLFDQEFGLLLYNLAVIPALVGLLPLWRRRPSAFIWVVLIVVFTLGPGLAYHMWWGGDSSPARCAAPVMPLAALPMAAMLADEKWKRWRKAAFFTGVCAIAIAVVLMMHTGLVTNQRDGTSRMLTSVSVAHFDLVELWPSWFAPFGQFWLQVALLVLSVIVSAVALYAFSAFLFGIVKDHLVGRFLAFGAVFLAFIMCLMVYGWLAEGLTPGEPNGREPHFDWSDLIYQQRYRHGNYSLIDQQGSLREDSLPGHGFSASRLFSGWALSADELAPGGRSWRFRPGQDEILLRSSTPFWAGDYRLDLNLRSESGEARVRFTVFDESEIGVTPWEPLAGTDAVLPDEFRDVRIPISLSMNSLGIRIYIETDQPLRFTQAIVRALSLGKLNAWSLPSELFDLAELRFNDYMIFTDTHAVFVPDGKWVWTRGDSEASWTVVAPRPFVALQISLVGHPPVSAELACGEFSHKVDFKHSGERKSLEVPVEARRYGESWLTRLSLRTFGVFVPAEVVEGSADRRQLGVHTRITLLRRK